MGCHRSASGELDIVGRTMPLPPACTAEVAESTTVAKPDHPWPEMLPPSWASSGRQPVAYVRVIPTAPRPRRRPRQDGAGLAEPLSTFRPRCVRCCVALDPDLRSERPVQIACLVQQR